MKIFDWLLGPPEVKKLPEGTPLPDIIGKMLTDSGCTVNKEAVEKVAEYFISTCLQIAQDGKVKLEQIQREIKDERAKW